MNKIQIIRGFNDILPTDSHKWQYLESKIKNILQNYNYDEVRLPILEKSELFHRSVGESSDIVSKETYDFTDRSGDSLTLRPEGTAGCVRMVVENNLTNRGQTQKLWYCGPMFRYERPQKGRYRQFYQLGVEAYGFDSLAIELEMISIAWNLFKGLDISQDVVLEINCLGSNENRKEYTKALLEYLKPFHNDLDEDSLKRLNKNPLRILDSKVLQTQEIIKDAPKLVDFIDTEELDKFNKTCEYAQSLGINYIVNKNLVRGLDYYSGLVFEWTTDKLGAQSAICAGGRYDALVANLGGQKTPAIGFAIGMERLLLLLDVLGKLPIDKPYCDVYIVVDNKYVCETFLLLETIRNELAGLRFDSDLKMGSIKSQLKKADKSGAKIAIVIGEEEFSTKMATIKDLRIDRPIKQVAFNDLLNYLEGEI